jgi:ATP-dependent RNA helicase DeaD
MLSGTVRQIYYTVRDKNKPKALCKILDVTEDFYGLVFCQTKAIVTALTDHLKARGYKVDSLHGDKSQSERERTLGLFKERNTTVLVCSDVAARGLDVKDLTHVINYSLPMEIDNYVHRIGRTGRNGKLGLAMALVGPSHLHLVDRIERRTRTRMEPGTLPTQEAILATRLARLLPLFTQVKGHESTRKLLDQTWKPLLETMTQVEVAERILLLALPHLFDDREKAEELEMAEVERRPRDHTRFAGPNRNGPQRRGAGPQRPWRKPFRNDKRVDDQHH